MSVESADKIDSTGTGRAAKRFRVDFVQKVISFDEAARVVQFSLVPDPRRYARVEKEGGTWYLDRYFNTLFRLEDFANASTEGLPVFVSDRSIESAPEYAARRKDAISLELVTGEHEPPEEKPRLHETLLANDAVREMAFLSVDICGSTAYRRRDQMGFDLAFGIILEEMGTVVGQFQGSLLKPTGDGFIAYIDGPSYTVVVDSAIDLGCSLLCMLRDAINPALEERGLEPISIRIGADYGPAIVQELRVRATDFVNVDVTSDALNRAVKIEQSATPNSFRIGQDLYELAHIQWLERSQRVAFDGDSIGISGYEVFEVQ